MTVAISNHEHDYLPERPNTGHLQLRSDQSNWTDEQRAALVQIGIADAPEADQMVFLHYCQRTGLDPFAKQIYLIKRWDQGGDKWTVQTAIEGLRLVGERHPQYAGQTEPEWCGEDGVWRDVWPSSAKTPPAAARVKVMRRDWDLPAVGIVHFDEFAQTKKGGGLTHMWATKGAHQLAKCAEAAALRKAFPNDLSGLYTPDEMGAADRPAGRVTLTQHTPVTRDEIRGTPPAKPAAADESHQPDRMTQPQQRKLFALLREHDIKDRNDWASGVLGREITSYSQLTQGDAARLIDGLDDEPTPPAPTTEG